MSKCKDLQIFKGTTKIYDIIFKKNGIVTDISDWTVYFTAKEKMKDEDNIAKIKKDISSHLDPVNGKTVIELSADDTDLPTKSYYYDISYKDDEGNVGVLLWGRLKIAKPVTTRA